MRIKVGIALYALNRGSSATGLVIVRTDADMIFYSTARIFSPSTYLGTVHTDWIPVPSGVGHYYSELRGKTLRVKLLGTCRSFPGGTVVQARLVAGGAEGGPYCNNRREYSV